MRGGFTKSGPGDSQNRVPRSFFLSVSYSPEPRVGGAAPGDRRWTGATPPFCCPQRARGRCAIHICATPPGGVAPVQIIPGGKAKTKNENRVDLSPQTPRMRRDTYQPKNSPKRDRGSSGRPHPPMENQRFPTGCFALPPVQLCHRSPRPPAQPVPFALAPGSPEPGVACDDGQNPIPDPSQTRFSPIQANWRACFSRSHENSRLRRFQATSRPRDRFAPTGKLARGTHSYGTRQTKAPGSAPER